MKVILLQDVKGIGRKYEVKDVADGHANNFLIPRKLAQHASPEAVKRFQMLKSATEAELQIREELTKKQIEILKDVKVSLQKKANEKGHLFEQIHTEEAAEALKNQAKVEIDSQFIKIEKPIKEIGEHKVLVEVGKNRGEFTLVVEPV